MKISKRFSVTDWNKQDYRVSIKVGRSIQIDCIYKNSYQPKPTSRTLSIGDMAEYDSYNLSYMGKIVQITEKTVCIQPAHESGYRRLPIADFCWRNWDFDVEKKKAENELTAQHI